MCTIKEVTFIWLWLSQGPENFHLVHFYWQKIFYQDTRRSYGRNKEMKIHRKVERLKSEISRDSESEGNQKVGRPKSGECCTKRERKKERPTKITNEKTTWKSRKIDDRDTRTEKDIYHEVDNQRYKQRTEKDEEEIQDAEQWGEPKNDSIAWETTGISDRDEYTEISDTEHNIYMADMFKRMERSLGKAEKYRK